MAVLAVIKSFSGLCPVVDANRRRTRAGYFRASPAEWWTHGKNWPWTSVHCGTCPLSLWLRTPSTPSEYPQRKAQLHTEKQIHTPKPKPTPDCFLFVFLLLSNIFFLCLSGLMMCGPLAAPSYAWPSLKHSLWPLHFCINFIRLYTKWVSKTHTKCIFTTIFMMVMMIIIP